MTEDEVLAKSREENKTGDIYEQEIINQSRPFLV